MKCHFSSTRKREAQAAAPRTEESPRTAPSHSLGSFQSMHEEGERKPSSAEPRSRSTKAEHVGHRTGAGVWPTARATAQSPQVCGWVLTPGARGQEEQPESRKPRSSPGLGSHTLQATRASWTPTFWSQPEPATDQRLLWACPNKA